MNNNIRMKPPTPATLTIREDSHTTSKPKPKIRIVHIIAPEIIKTDAANFRELVQRLTGKHATRAVGKREKVRLVSARNRLEAEKRDDHCGMWRAEENLSAGGFLSDLAEVDGFLQGFTDFPMHPLSSSAHMDHMIGELSQVA